MPVRSLGSSGLQAKYQDEALLILEAISPPADLPFPNRHILLTKDNPTVRIGRTSKRNPNFEATKNNAYFDSAVISREHALLSFDHETQRVFLSDEGSLHGTFHNDATLNRENAIILHDGDVLRFGIPIERGSEVHPPCTMEAYLRFGNESRLDNRPTVFKVPDETDIEDVSSDEDVDESQINHTVGVLINDGFEPAALNPTVSAATSIDLTSNTPNLFAGATSDQQGSPKSAPHQADNKSGSIANIINVVDLTSQRDDESQRDEDGLDGLDGLEDMERLDYTVWDVSQDREDSLLPDAEANSQDSLSDAYEMDEKNLSSASPSSFDSEASNASDDSDDRDDLSADEEDQDDLDDIDEHDVDEDQEHAARPILESATHADLDDSYYNHNGSAHHERELAATSGVSIPDILSSSAPGTYNRTDGAPGTMIFPTMTPQIVESTRLPPLPTEPHAQPYSGRLPSLFRTRDQAVHVPDHGTARVHGAEWLGAKTGKMEYFSAREQNRLNMNVAAPLPADCGSLSPINPKQGHPCRPSYTLNDTISCETPHVVMESPSSRPEQLNTAPGAWYAAPGAWSTSGTNFLNSPPAEFAVPAPWSTDPPLDETSAYAFEASRKAALAKPAYNLQSESPQIPSVRGAEPVKSFKRKAAEISRLTPEEKSEELNDEPEVALESEAIGFASPMEPAMPPVANMISNSPVTAAKSSTPPALISLTVGEADAAVPAALTSKYEDDRPAKRLRRVAEVFGIAALGGAVVMSALIATAPSF